MLCQLVFQPIIKLIQIVVSVIEWVLVTICQLIQELVNVLTSVLQYICNTVVQTVCGAVCSVICGICDFFCGIFGCDCGCENVCNNVCNVITNVVCGWTWILTWVLQAITTLVCNYILRAFIALLNIIEAIVTMVLTWICTVIDVFIRWLLCWTYLAEIFNNTDSRRLKVAPKIVPNNQGYSDWFVYVNNPNTDGSVSQNTQGYILSDKGKPLAPIAEPFLYYAYKMLEIASHLLGDVFATDPSDDGTGTDYHKNLLTYNHNVQRLLAKDKKLASNNYNNWTGKYTNASDQNYFGDGSVTDMGMRVDTDNCSHPTNTFLNLVNEKIEFTPANSTIAETMSCGAGQTLTFDQTNFLMLNKDDDSSAITTYLVSKYSADDSSVGCNDLLGYTVVTFEGSDQPLFVASKVLAFDADTNTMMARIVENISGTNQKIVRAAETYLHESGHQCGLLHDSDKPDCENDTTLHISKVMNPGGSVRRAYTRLQWCMIRTSPYVTSASRQAFTKASELPDSDR